MGYSKEFEEIDAILNGSLSAVISEAWSIACETGNYYKGYSWGKRFVSTLVGWESRVRCLRTRRAYEIAIVQLANACEDGEMASKAVEKRWGHLSPIERAPYPIFSAICDFRMRRKLAYERKAKFFYESSPGEV